MCMLALENSELSGTFVQASEDLWQTCIIHELLFSLLGIVDLKKKKKIVILEVQTHQSLV